MALPPLIEIVPLREPVSAQLTVPGSKSITNRALVLAALAQGETTLQGALWSEDTQVMVTGLQQLGFRMTLEPDPRESCNRRIQVEGQGGRIPNGGTPAKPLELFVGNAGTAARFLAALVCLGDGCYRLHGAPRMHERPQAALFDALRELGYCIDTVNNRLPATFHGAGGRGGTCCVSIEEGSQFASALLLCAQTAGWHVNVVGDNPEASPYVQMTRQLLKVFPRQGGVFAVEADASSGSYFWAADHLLKPMAQCQNRIAVADWPTSGWQIDADFPKYLPLPETLSRQSQLGDSIMTAIMLAPFAGYPVRFTHLRRLRLQECERVQALRSELAKCGAAVLEQKDTLTVLPAATPLHGAEIETYHDHRMAMCFAILGLKVPGVKIKNPVCVKKTFPNFFQKLAAPPSAGLGATILDGAAGQPMRVEDLFVN